MHNRKNSVGGIFRNTGHTPNQWCHSRCFPLPVKGETPAVTSLVEAGQGCDMFQIQSERFNVDVAQRTQT